MNKVSAVDTALPKYYGWYPI